MMVAFVGLEKRCGSAQREFSLKAEFRVTVILKRFSMTISESPFETEIY